MGWDFAKTEDKTLSGANIQAFESFNDNDSIIREIIQNSLDAKREECDYVIVEIGIDERFKQTFPSRRQLRKTLESCKSVFKESDTKTTKKLHKMIDSIDQEKHYILTFKDMNTTGLLGGLDIDSDQSSNLYQLIYGEGTTNKNTKKSSGGSFGIGKNAPFTRSSIKSVFYDTFNTDNERYIVGKSILTSHKSEGSYRSKYGYYVEGTEEICDYLGNMGVKDEYGTAVHIPFYELKNNDIQNELSELTRDILLNFMVAIDRGKLEVRFDNKLSGQKEVINQENYAKVVENLISGEDKSKETYKKIKAIHNLLSNEKTKHCKVELCDLPKGNHIELYVALSEYSTGYKKYFNVREQLMLIEEKMIPVSNFKYDAMAIYHGTEINNILRDAEPPEHNKWTISKIDGKSNQKIFRNAKSIVEKKIKEYFSETIDDEIVLEEFNNSMLSATKNIEDFYTIRKLDDKSNLKDKGGSGNPGTAKLNSSNRKIRNKDKSNDKSTYDIEGNVQTKVMELTNVTKRIRSRGNGKYEVTLLAEHNPDPRQIRVYSKTDTGKEERITNFKIVDAYLPKFILQIDDVELDIMITIEESNED